MWMALLGPLPKPAWFGNVGEARLHRRRAADVDGARQRLRLVRRRVLLDVYAAGERAHGISPQSDQVIAGSIMMVEGSILTLCLFCWLFLRSAREGEERQELLELAAAGGVALDERRAARAVAAGRGAELRRRIEQERAGRLTSAACPHTSSRSSRSSPTPRGQASSPRRPRRSPTTPRRARRSRAREDEGQAARWPAARSAGARRREHRRRPTRPRRQRRRAVDGPRRQPPARRRRRRRPPSRRCAARRARRATTPSPKPCSHGSSVAAGERAAVVALHEDRRLPQRERAVPADVGHRAPAALPRSARRARRASRKPGSRVTRDSSNRPSGGSSRSLHSAHR